MTDLPEENTFRAFPRSGKTYRPRPPRAPELKIKPGDTPEAERVSLEAIADEEGSRKCRWPYGSVDDGTFAFCGKPTTGPSSSWCRTHRKRAYYTVGSGSFDASEPGDPELVENAA